MVVVMKHGISSNILIGVLAQDYADCGIITLCTLQIVVHAHIHIHLPDILMGDTLRFQVYQHVAFENDIVEYEVYIIILGTCANELLTFHESKALTHLHYEVLKMVYNGGLQIALSVFRIRRNAKELRYYRTFDEFKGCLCMFFVFIIANEYMRRLKMTLVILRADIPV